MNVKTLNTTQSKSGFSLIELMIVIVILGSLTAIILPQFDSSEATAKDTGCDASNYGTLSQLSKYRSLNGVYPAGMHTGLAVKGTTGLMGDDNTAVIPSFTKPNMLNSAASALTQSQADSLYAAGIVNLAYGGFPADTSNAVTAKMEKVGTDGTPHVAQVTAPWYESWKLVNGVQTEGAGLYADLNAAGAPITINGLSIEQYQFPGREYGDYDSTVANPTKDGIVVPLFIAPTTNWEQYYVDGAANASKIGVSQEGACPWLEGGVEFRYYIAFFKVYDNGAPAKLLGTTCPEGGSLNP